MLLTFCDCNSNMWIHTWLRAGGCHQWPIRGRGLYCVRFLSLMTNPIDPIAFLRFSCIYHAIEPKWERIFNHLLYCFCACHNLMACRKGVWWECLCLILALQYLLMQPYQARSSYEYRMIKKIQLWDVMERCVHSQVIADEQSKAILHWVWRLEHKVLCLWNLSLNLNFRNSVAYIDAWSSEASLLNSLLC